ncbi:Surfeit locus protein 1 [Nowakowskiella sp. JEL0078]|nr:Surfeit locus protein 1 [Nowakowskiella sp. JEL0078]
MAAPATPVNSIEDLENLSEYKKIYLKGQFLHDSEVFLGPRTYLSHASNIPVPTASKPTIGYYVVTPFKLADSNKIVLVKRGWIPKEKKESLAKYADVVTIEGIRRSSEKVRHTKFDD